MSNQKPESDRNRREFLHTAFWAFASLPLAGAALSACTKTPGTADSSKSAGSTNESLPTGEQAVKEEDPIATSLGYLMNATKVDTAKFPKRKGPEGEKQFCKNCQFYTAKNDGWGGCQIIRAGLVNANGWCNTWAQKPGTT